MKHLVAGLTLALTLACPPAFAAETISLTPEETEALKLKLIQAKPNVSTVTMAGFLFPGSAQAYMGHTDRTFLMWGAYLLVFAGSKYYWADTDLTAGLRTSDLAISGAFMAMAAYSAVDAFIMASSERAEYDKLIYRLDDKAHPTVKGTNAVPEKR
jgi:hypothetical protein